MSYHNEFLITINKHLYAHLNTTPSSGIEMQSINNCGSASVHSGGWSGLARVAIAATGGTTGFIRASPWWGHMRLVGGHSHCYAAWFIVWRSTVPCSVFTSFPLYEYLYSWEGKRKIVFVLIGRKRSGVLQTKKTQKRSNNTALLFYSLGSLSVPCGTDSSISPPF